MSDINLTMTNWKIPLSTSTIFLGESGENRAITLSIKVDSIVEADDVKYYLDICDKVDGENPTARSQEMEIIKETENISGIGDVDIYYLQMKPQAKWLGKNNIKFLQVRCEYTDITIDEETDEEIATLVILKSNPFFGYVGKGILGEEIIGFDTNITHIPIKSI